MYLYERVQRCWGVYIISDVYMMIRALFILDFQDILGLFSKVDCEKF